MSEHCRFCGHNTDKKCECGPCEWIRKEFGWDRLCGDRRRTEEAPDE